MMPSTSSPPRLEKDIGFIVSGGRTGTAFLGRYLSEMVPDCASFHEPDILDGVGLRTLRSVRRFGFYHMIIGRLLGRTGIRTMSEQFLAGELEPEEAMERLRQQRFAFYRSFEQELLIEAYYQWYGLLPLLPRVFSSYRVAAIIRDPRTWVPSWLAEGGHHGQRDWVSRLGFRRLDPVRLGYEEWSQKWHRLSTFEKLCWEWTTVYTIIGGSALRDSNIQVFKYEELFGSVQEFECLLKFLTTYSRQAYAYKTIPELLGRRVNVRREDAIPEWHAWPDGWIRVLARVCGSRMGSYGYGQEPEWKRRVREVSRI